MKVGILGCGAMGSGIAQVAARAGCEVTLYDHFAQAREASAKRLRETLDTLALKGKLSPQEADATYRRFHFADHLSAFAGCDLVIEAIVEEMAAKQAAFRELDAALPPETILATNTSSLSVAAIAAACVHPERVIGLHFFNPAPLMELVEVIPAVQTDLALAGKLQALMREWKKIPVLARDTPGFIVNRVARPFYTEALRIYDEGIASPATIDWAMTTLGGFRMGPFALMDFIGHDVNFRVTESLYTASYHEARYRPSLSQQRLLEAGYLGRKSGRGFYRYEADASNPAPDTDPGLGQQILERILLLLINEAAEAVLYGIASREDIDLAMTKGVNYPKGLLQWAEEKGFVACVAGLDRLYDEYREERYRCSVWLRRMARG